MRWWPLLVLVIGTTILFAPVPFILQESASCLPCDPSLPRAKCPKCPQKGDVEWRPSLAKRLYSKLTRSEQWGELIPTTTPAPTGAIIPVVPITSRDREINCKQYGGTWLEKYQECEGIGKSACDTLGGNFSECDSACRHDPAANKCITLCVRVCKLN